MELVALQIIIWNKPAQYKKEHEKIKHIQSRFWKHTGVFYAVV